jgi:hypothetical protein
MIALEYVWLTSQVPGNTSPSAPTGLHLDRVSRGEITLGWDAVVDVQLVPIQIPIRPKIMSP